MSVVEETLGRTFDEHRAHLLGVAYRIVGTVADAEDAVQEAWLRLAGLGEQGRAEIRELRAWLTTVVGRICLDRLRSAAAQRERYVGTWLPEPVVTPLAGREGDPLTTVVQNADVRMAALLVLQQLSPEQRVAFVLHDAFGVPFAEIGEVLGCAEATARQHASRGRRAVAQADPPERVAIDEQRELIESFLAALASGDTAAVVRLLHPDAVVLGDSNGKARTARHPIHGAEKIARFVFGLLSGYGDAAIGKFRPVLVNGDLGIATEGAPAEDGRRWALQPHVTAFSIRDGRIFGVYDIANPDKLTRMQL